MLMTDLYFFFIPACLVISEICLQSAWNNFYFNFGIRICKLKLKTVSDEINMPWDVLNSKMHSSFFLMPSIVFKKLKNGNYAFREKYWWPSFYTPIVHGLIVHERNKNSFFINFSANLSPLMILIIEFLYSYIVDHELNFNSFFLPYFLFSLTVQFFRFAYVIFYCRSL